MTETYFPFDAGAGSNVVENQWAKMARLWRSDGVIRTLANDLAVSGDSSGMNVKIATGSAWIKGGYYENDAIITLAIDASHATLHRYDRIIVRIDWIANTIAAAVVKGTPGASPSVPALTQTFGTLWEIPLAIVYIAATVTVINAAGVTDARLFSGISANIILFGASGVCSTTDGATTPVKIEMATNKENLFYPSFPTALKKYLEWDFVMPDDYNGGTVTCEFFWTANSVSTNSVVWGMQARAFADGDVIDQALGTTQEVTDANVATAYTDRKSAATAALTIAGTPVAGQSVRFRAYRLGSGADNLAASALLKAVRINYTRS